MFLAARVNVARTSVVYHTIFSATQRYNVGTML